MFAARFKPVSNQADWQSLIQITDKATGALLDLTGGTTPLTWTIEARLQGERWLRPWLKAATGDGSGYLSVAGLGLLQILFPVTVMQGLEIGSYEMFLGVTNGTLTRQIYLGLLPVVGKHTRLAPGYGSRPSYYG